MSDPLEVVLTVMQDAKMTTANSLRRICSSLGKKCTNGQPPSTGGIPGPALQNTEDYVTTTTEYILQIQLRESKNVAPISKPHIERDTRDSKA